MITDIHQLLFFLNQQGSGFRCDMNLLLEIFSAANLLVDLSMYLNCCEDIVLGKSLVITVHNFVYTKIESNIANVRIANIINQYTKIRQRIVHKISRKMLCVEHLLKLLKFYCIFIYFLYIDQQNYPLMSSSSSSLPRVKVSLEKFPNFFSERSKSRDLALQQRTLQTLANTIDKTVDVKKKAHLKNLQFIQRKSNIKHRVEAYLIESSKIGILDHHIDDLQRRRSLTKISLQSLKQNKTPSEQQITYLMHLKEELSNCHDKYQKTEDKIKICQALKSQTKEQIIYYVQKIFSTESERRQLLQQRSHDLVLAQYQGDKLKAMLERLKSINSHLQRNVQEAHNRLRVSQKSINNLDNVNSVGQQNLQKQINLLRRYEDFQNQKSSGLHTKIKQTVHKVDQRHITTNLEKHQQSIKIMSSTDYHNQMIIDNHVKYIQEMLIHRFYSKMLGELWAEQISRYENYQKADNIIRMNSFDRNSSVQDSYRGSFSIRADLQKTISQKQNKLKILQAKNKLLKKEWHQIHFYDNSSNSTINIQQQHKLVDDNKDFYGNQSKFYIRRSVMEYQRVSSLTDRLKQWVKKQEKTLNIAISKKAPMEQRIISVILKILQGVREQVALNPQNTVKAKSSSKVNKFGNTIKKK